MFVPSVEDLLSPWREALGRDFLAYRHHVERVLALSAHLAGGVLPDPLAFRVAGVYHDLGIWTDRTFDYLAPSARRAAAWLREHGLAELAPRVEALILDHHRIRAAGPADDPVEIFRRADWIDVTLGLRRFGVPRAIYRDIVARFPDAGFHLRLLQLGAKRLLTHPTRPLPMLRW